MTSCMFRRSPLPRTCGRSSIATSGGDCSASDCCRGPGRRCRCGRRERSPRPTRLLRRPLRRPLGRVPPRKPRRLPLEARRASPTLNGRTGGARDVSQARTHRLLKKAPFSTACLALAGAPQIRATRPWRYNGGSDEFALRGRGQGGFDSRDEFRPSSRAYPVQSARRRQQNRPADRTRQEIRDAGSCDDRSWQHVRRRRILPQGQAERNQTDYRMRGVSSAGQTHRSQPDAARRRLRRRRQFPSDPAGASRASAIGIYAGC